MGGGRWGGWFLHRSDKYGAGIRQSVEYPTKSIAVECVVNTERTMEGGGGSERDVFKMFPDNLLASGRKLLKPFYEYAKNQGNTVTELISKRVSQYLARLQEGCNKPSHWPWRFRGHLLVGLVNF